MTDRREQVLDAAIEVVGGRGLRALTHRAVDAEAGLGAGSTSNLFRRRHDLVAGMLGRLLERESAAWTSTAPGPGRGAPGGDALDDVTEFLADRVRLLTGPLRSLTVARFALFGEVAVDPSLTTQVVDSRAAVASGVGAWLAAAGLPVDDVGVSGLLSTLNGLLVERLAMPPDLAPDPVPVLRAVLGYMTTTPSAPHSTTACSCDTMAPAR